LCAYFWSKNNIISNDVRWSKSEGCTIFKFYDLSGKKNVIRAGLFSFVLRIEKNQSQNPNVQIRLDHVWKRKNGVLLFLIQTSCLVSTCIVLGPTLDTLRLCLRHSLDNESDLSLFFKGLLKKETEYVYVNSIYNNNLFFLKKLDYFLPQIQS
jgi:hypothetical protein